MTNLNFFGPRIGEQAKSRQRLMRIGGGVMVICLLAGIVAGYNYFTAASLRNKIEAAQADLNSPQMQAQYATMRLMRLRQQLSQRYLDELRKVDAHVAAVDVIGAELFAKLTATLPSGVSFSNLTVNVNSFNASATATSLRNVAELRYNLEQSGLLSQVNIGSLSGPGGGPYSFSLTGTFR